MNTLNEQVELQQEVDNTRHVMISELSPEDQAKHRICEDALDLLHKAGIDAYLYAALPAQYSEGIPCVFQYNTLQANVSYDENGNVTEESKERIHRFNLAMWTSKIYTIMQTPYCKAAGMDKHPKSQEEANKQLSYITFYIAKSLNDYNSLFFKSDDET